MKKVFIVFSGVMAFSHILFSQQKQDSIPLQKLQEVQVTATRAGGKTPMAFSNIGKVEISKQNFGQDIPFLLSLSPSVVTTSDAGAGMGYTGLRIRGTDASRINVTTNGIPLNDSESHGVYWVNMPDFASSVEDLQIQRGVGSSTNGAAAFGATLNMKTENASVKPYAEVGSSYGSFNTSKATFKAGTGLLNGHWAFDARLSKIHSDGYVDRATTDLNSYFAQAGYFSQNTVVKLVTFGGKEKTYHAWYGAPKDSLATNRTYNPAGDMGNGKFYDNQTDNYQQTHYQLIMTHIFSPEWNLNAALHYTKGKGYYEEYKTGKTLSTYGLKDFTLGSETISESDLVQQKWLDNDFGGLVFSLNYAKDKLSGTLGGGINEYKGDNFGKIIWVKSYAGDNNFAPGQEFYRSKGDKKDRNLFVKVNYEALPGLNAYADVQYRRIDYTIKGKNDKYDWNTSAMQDLDISKTFNFVNPKLGLFYQVNNQNSAYMSFAIGNREPTRANYTDAVKSQTPTSERLNDWEFGYTFANESFTIGANVYYMDYKNQLILTGKINDVGEALTTNIADSYRHGIELMAGYKYEKWFQWNANATFSENKIKNFSEFVDDWDNWPNQIENKIGNTPIAFSPTIIANNQFTFVLNQADISIQSNYVSRQYVDNTGNRERSIDPYFVSNLRFGYNLKLNGIKSARIGLLVNNIFNEKYENNAWAYSYYEGGVRKVMDGYFAQAGTNVMASLSIRF